MRKFPLAVLLVAAIFALTAPVDRAKAMTAAAPAQLGLSANGVGAEKVVWRRGWHGWVPGWHRYYRSYPLPYRYYYPYRYAYPYPYFVVPRPPVWIRPYPGPWWGGPRPWWGWPRYHYWRRW
jgi:hypothetical protein